MTFKGKPELVEKMPTTLLLSISQNTFPDEIIKIDNGECSIY